MRPSLIVSLALVSCAHKPMTPAEIERVRPGQDIVVHVWAYGAPGPGYVVSGTLESQDATKVVVLRGKERVEIPKVEIHDDSRDVH